MPTKQELHRLIDELPDELTESQLEGVRQVIHGLVGTGKGAVVATGYIITGASDSGDTAMLTGLSSSALLRDWASDEDSVYDDD